MVIDDRIEDEKLAIDKYFPPFFSILLPELARPHYVLNCIKNIFKYADMPFEIIVHDDGSPEEMQRELFEILKDKCSTLIFNFGHNVGLGRAQNRCRAMASSKYLMSFNTDIFMTSGFLTGIKEALDLPYVGMVNVRSAPKSMVPGIHNLYITPSGYRVWLSSGIGDTTHFGIRAENWDKVGGWNENVQSTASDIGFSAKVFAQGLFTAVVDGTRTNEQWLKTPDGKINTHVPDPNYVSCLGHNAEYSRGDCNVPRIFKLWEQLHDLYCERRRAAIWERVNIPTNKDPLYPHWYSPAFTNSQVVSLFPANKGINWEFAKTYGHDKWKDMVIKDFNLEA